MPTVLLLLLCGGAVGLLSFSEHVQDHMVLQRAPSKSAVYGTLSSSGTAKVVVKVSGSASYEVEGTVDGSNWIAYLKPAPAGGSYTIVASCTGCSDGDNTATISDVTFGDVWYCSGQSNMALPLLHTMSRNISFDAIRSGKYRNIRVHQLQGNMNPTMAWMTVLNATTTEIKEKGGAVPLLSQFSSTCYYYAESLTDLLGDEAPPLGMIHTAWGGSQVQEWTSNATSAMCRDVKLTESSQTFLDQRVMPFVKMTVKGFVWYQGENNMASVFGNSMRGTGYACEVTRMIAEWRDLFSAEPGTTDPLAPFGVVTLASSGTEGHPDIGGMFEAQTGSYGVVPNPAMPNTFLAHAFDLADPYGNITCYQKACCPGMTPKPGTICSGCEGYCASTAGTNFYMGPIHPRDKKPLGDRLARAAAEQVYRKDVRGTGPIVSGCSLEGTTLTIKFNRTLLAGDTVAVGPYYKPAKASYVQVLTNSSMFCLQTAAGPSRDVLTCLDDGTGKSTLVGSDVHSLNTWPMVDVKVSGPSTIAADVSAFGGKIFGVRYAFFAGGYADCCGMRPHTSDPCPIASCPLKGTESGLPVTPFMARIVDGKCQCVAPQVCDE